jgi:hypothetical protein
VGREQLREQTAVAVEMGEQLPQRVAQRHNTSLNPQASLEGLDPDWVADEIAIALLSGS